MAELEAEEYDESAGYYYWDDEQQAYLWFDGEDEYEDDGWGDMDPADGHPAGEIAVPTSPVAAGASLGSGAAAAPKPKKSNNAEDVQLSGEVVHRMLEIYDSMYDADAYQLGDFVTPTAPGATGGVASGRPSAVDPALAASLASPESLPRASAARRE